MTRVWNAVIDLPVPGVLYKPRIGIIPGYARQPVNIVILGAQGKDGTGLPITQLKAYRKHSDKCRRQSTILTYATVRETVANAVGPSAHRALELVCVMELRNPIARDWSGSSLAS